MLTELMSGNEAFARGAYEAGVVVAAGYPGTPSTEILENVVKYKSDIYAEWSPNEKVALEMAAGASMAGARSIVTMKHVGLNVAADPLMTLAYIGVQGGMVIIVADDPGMHSSQNEQDSRHYARFAKVPLLEPSDSQEAKDFVLFGIELSEKYNTPVIVRSNTRISHSRTPVELGSRREPHKVGFEKDPSKYVTVPLWAREMRKSLEHKLPVLVEEACKSSLNRIEMRGKTRGVITSSIAYQYVRDAWPKASVLKLGFVHPFPDELIREFAGRVDELVIVEELDDFLEQHVKSLGLRCKGREFIPGIGELNTTILLDAAAKMEGKAPSREVALESDTDLPARPPVLCPGCPHRSVFYALGKHDVIVAGDIGCYSLGAFKPLNRLDSILCMGGGISMAHGLDKSCEPKKVVGMLGDSTFFHSGITGLLDIAYNKGKSTIIVVDNRTTAMTGHQENPGTGRTLMGDETISASIAEIGRACGIKRVREINPYDMANTQKVVTEEINADEASLIVSVAPCVLRERKPLGAKRHIHEKLCKNCRACLKLGCPAIEGGEGKPRINPLLCTGCAMCEYVCPFGAIAPVEEKK